MIKQAVHQLWITSGIALCCLAVTSPVRAQIVPDVTLGSEKSTVKPNVLIKDLPSDRIDGGVIRGTNLFHSFREFNIEKGRGVYFTNPDGIENILSRVTGGNHSKILGTLGVLGKANLFLLNPNGILFGPSASLDIGGSFLASTASSLKFKDGKQFSTVAPQTTTPLLTMSTPVGLQFGGTAGKIINRSRAGPRLKVGGSEHPVGLQVLDGRTLALVGGDVILGGNLTALVGENVIEGGNLTAKGGRIELGSVAGVGEVSLSQTGNRWELGYDSIDAFGDIRLEHGALVNTSGKGGGDVQVQGRRVTLMDRSWIEASTLGAKSGGVLSITASESVSLIGGTSVDRRFRRGLFAQVKKGATGHGGKIVIDTGQLDIKGARITTKTNGAGAGGKIAIKTGQLSVWRGGQVVASTESIGKGGNLVVNASKSVELVGLSADKQSASALQAQVSEGATGQGGNITINTRRLIIENGAQVSTEVSTTKKGAKSGGNLAVTASESVKLAGKITTPEKTFRSRLSTEVDKDVGAGGNKPEAGNLLIITGRLTVRDGAEVTVSSKGVGNAGDLDVTADSIRLDGGKLNADTTAGRGNILLRSQDLVLRRASSITTDAQNTATGGNIIINTGVLAALENSDISADAQEGSGGRVEIDAQGIFGTEFRNQPTRESDITASSDLGPQFSGSVEINTPDVDPSQGLVTLPEEVVDASGLIDQGCSASGGTAGKGESEFVVTGRGGLPPTPRETVSNETVLEDWGKFSFASRQPQSAKRMLSDRVVEGDRPEPHSNSPTSSDPTQPVPASIVEAQGWAIGANGEVVLMAQAPTGKPHSLQLAIAACPGN